MHLKQIMVNFGHGQVDDSAGHKDKCQQTEI